MSISCSSRSTVRDHGQSVSMPTDMCWPWYSNGPSGSTTGQSSSMAV